MTWEADMLWEERLQRQAEMLSNTAQGFPVPQESKSPPKKASWPADKVERRKVKDLVPYAKNARTHSEERIQDARAMGLYFVKLHGPGTFRGVLIRW